MTAKMTVKMTTREKMTQLTVKKMWMTVKMTKMTVKKSEGDNEVNNQEDDDASEKDVDDNEDDNQKDDIVSVHTRYLIRLFHCTKHDKTPYTIEDISVIFPNVKYQCYSFFVSTRPFFVSKTDLITNVFFRPSVPPVSIT